jgi:hypothetical protein
VFLYRLFGERENPYGFTVDQKFPHPEVHHPYSHSMREMNEKIGIRIALSSTGLGESLLCSQ